MNYEDYDLPEFITSVHPRARKAHACYECREQIKIGETYRRVSGKWCGDFDCFKICNACEALRALLENHSGRGIPFGEVRMTLEEYEDEIPAMLVIAAAAS